MCGIAGIWGGTDEAVVREMMDRLVHRGPDAHGVHADDAGVLGHRRLSIMDPEGGNQPLYNEDRSCTIIANGEVYNHPKLRDRLSERHEFRTGSDTESVLHLYEDLGTALVNRMDGMFAVAIADGSQLVLARDPIGIKPLYYGRRDDALIFASELKALAGLAREVEEFPPGSIYHSEQGFRPYYVVPAHAPREMPLEIRLRRVRETLEDAVAKRMMSDVPVGAFLSGGLDSSLIAALTRQHVDELHTFSVGIEGSPDLEAARIVADHLDTVHHEHLFTIDEVVDHLPEIIYWLESYDQDLVRSAIPCYFVSRLAAEHVKVILTGEGADELFAGYDYYKGIREPETLHRELRRSVTRLHDVNLQRVDRLTMAHSIEGRVPFLDLELIELAQTIPTGLKLRRDGSGERVEKWILRKACEDLLPSSIIWREKEQFDEGSGTLDAIAGELDRWMSAEQAERYRQRFADQGLRSREESVYHRVLRDVFDDPDTVLDNVARWSERPELASGV